MRRTLAVTTVALSLTLSVVGSAAWSADDQRLRVPGGGTAPSAVPATPHAALATAQAVLAGQDRSDNGDATLALRDLFVAQPALSRADQASAQQALARPKQGNKKCSAHICVHWKRSGSDAAKGKWAKKTLS